MEDLLLGTISVAVLMRWKDAYSAGTAAVGGFNSVVWHGF